MEHDGVVNRLEKSLRKAIFTAAACAMVFLVGATSASAASVDVRFITYNVLFNNSAAQVQADINLLKPKADVLMFQEAKNVNINNMLGASWTVFHVTNQGDGKQGSALAVRNSKVSQVIDWGLRFGVDNHGEQMNDRYIMWADIKLTNGLTCRFMSLHFPPGRFEYLQPLMADNLVAFMDVTPYPVVIGGDWNFTVDNDKWNIEPRTGLTADGVGIDGFYYDSSVVTVNSIAKLHGLATQSDHKAVQMKTTIEPVPIIVDNSSAKFSASSNWATGSSASDKYGSNYRFRQTALVSDAASWDITVPYTGDYEIFAWWSQGANRSITAPYILPDSTTVYKNQQTGGGSWQSLGTLNLTAGTHTVQLSAWTGNGTVVIGDAIKAEPR